MILVRPITIDDTNFTSSNVAADTTPVWDSVTNYVQFDVVRVEAEHRLYESQTSNLNSYPPDNIGTDWVDLGATNRWAMFDDVIGTQTENTGSIEVVIEPGRANAVGLVNIVANYAQVVMTVDAVDVYDKTVNLSIANVTDWFEYFYEPIVRKTDHVFTDLPQYGDGVLTITLSGGVSDTIKCGSCIVGLLKMIGETQWGLSSGIKSYSTKDVNDFGGYSVTKRANAKRMELDVFLLNSQVDEAQRVLAEYDSIPILYIGSESYTLSIIYGFYNDFTVVLPGPGGSFCNITVEGLI